MSQKVRLKLRLQLIMFVLPASLLPLIGIVLLTVTVMYKNLVQTTEDLYLSLVEETSYSIDLMYDQYAITLTDITDMENFRRIVEYPAYKSRQEERSYKIAFGESGSKTGGGSIRRAVMSKISGDLFLVELYRESLEYKTPYKIHSFTDSYSTILDVSRIVESSLFKKMTPDHRMSFGLLPPDAVTGYKSSQRPVFLYGYNTSSEDEFSSVLIVLLGYDVINRIYDRVESFENGKVIVTDSQGTLMSTTCTQDDAEAILQLIPDLDSNIQTMIFNRQRLMIYHTVAEKSGCHTYYLHPYSRFIGPVIKVITLVVVSAGLIAVLIVFLAIIFSGRLSRPVTRLAGAARTIAEGNYIIPDLKIRSHNEIGLLADAFSTMVAKINNHSTEMEKTIAERTSELIIAKEDVEQIARQKTMFFINLAHETKTPLTLIKNYFERYCKSVPVTEELIIIQRNLDKLVTDVVNFLDIEKIDSRESLYDHDKITDLSQVLTDLVIFYQPEAGLGGMVINNVIDNDLYCKGDPVAWERVFSNLLDNGCKYSDSGDSITIESSINDGNIEITVSDTGMGMDNERIAHIFEPFYQLSHRKNGRQGIGMGLSIVKKIIDSIGAVIDVTSKPGVGSTFVIRMNAVSPADKRIKQQKASQKMVPGKINSKTFKKQINSELVLGTLLIVEDNKQLLTFLEESFSRRYSVTTAENGIEALQKLKDGLSPDLIISDIMMDKMDGMELLEEIRNMPDYDDIPFIFLTAKQEETSMLHGLSAGAVEYIAKPFAIDELMARVDALVEQRQKIMEKSSREIQKRIADFLAGTVDGQKPGVLDTAEYFEQFCRKYSISRREAEIISLLSDGLQNKEIADKLNLSVRTIESHIYHIYDRCAVGNRIELINLLRSSAIQ